MIDAPMVDRTATSIPPASVPTGSPKPGLRVRGAADLGANSKKLFMLSDRTTKDGFPARWITSPPGIPGWVRQPDQGGLPAGYRPEMIISSLASSSSIPSPRRPISGSLSRRRWGKDQSQRRMGAQGRGKARTHPRPQGRRNRGGPGELDIAESRLWKIPGRK